MRCDPFDDRFLYDVFCTTWSSQVAALPDQSLARHVLRIQHTAQEQRFASEYPDHERLVVARDGERVGRLYLFQTPSSVHVVDLTLLPRARSQGIGTRVFADLMGSAAADGRSLTARVSRRNTGAIGLCAALGFRLDSVDDLDSFLSWSAADAGRTDRTSGVTAASGSPVPADC